MQDQIHGEIDLRRLRDLSHSTSFIQSLEMRGTSFARSAHAACVVLGNPRLSAASQTLDLLPGGIAAALLRSWDTHGTAITGQLQGGYAIVIADAKQGSVFVAVDRFAICTICYRFDGHSINFSDRADCVSGHNSAMDPQAVFDYLFFHSIPAPRTIFGDVCRVPAAHGLLVDRHGARLMRHWHLHFDELGQRDFGAAKDMLRSRIRDAVARELDGEKKVGAFLSGGTDSSTVAGMLGQVSGRPAPAYSIGFEAQGYDEMEYARLSAKHFGCDHHEYYVTPADLLSSIPAVAQHHDQPFGNSSALPAYYCAKMAKEDGCSKLLAGDGGDELFGGNTRYAMQKFLAYYQSVPPSIRHIIEPLCGDGSILRRIPGLRQATGYVRHSRMPMPHRMQEMNLIMAMDPRQLLTADYLDRISLTGPATHMQATWDECDAASIVNRMLAYDWRYTLADSDIPKVRGAAAMANIAVAYPLLSDDLVDFSMELPENWKLRRFKLRWFFKEALRGFLPDAVLTKKKQGFGLPHGQWMTSNPKLLDLARDSLHGLAGRGIVRREFVQQLIDVNLGKHPGYYGEMVWILMMLEQWMRGQPGKSYLASTP